MFLRVMLFLVCEKGLETRMNTSFSAIVLNVTLLRMVYGG
jgi:hypothetical protein